MVDTKMDFQEWWAQRGHCMWRDDKALASHVAKAAWDAATLAERERCAKLVTTGDYCRYVDHNNGTCDCADMAAAIRAS